ncbi:MAG: universal stress protein [Hyphomonas sp.]
MLRNILVATEFSGRCHRAVARAGQLASQTGAGLTMVHVSDDGKAGRRELEQEANAAGASWRLGDGDPSRFILGIAQETSADLIVLGAPQRSSVRDFLSGTAAEKVIRHSAVPVLMAVASPPLAYHKVILATDFSEASEQAVAGLKKTGLADGCLLHLVTVYDTPEIPLMVRAGTSTAGIDAYIVEQGRNAAAKLAEFNLRTGAGAAASIPKLGDASTGRMICSVASDTGADLIVVGTQGRTGIRRFVLGSVAEEVLRLSDVDVLAVPAA